MLHAKLTLLSIYALDFISNAVTITIFSISHLDYHWSINLRSLVPSKSNLEHLREYSIIEIHLAQSKLANYTDHYSKTTFATKLMAVSKVKSTQQNHLFSSHSRRCFPNDYFYLIDKLKKKMEETQSHLILMRTLLLQLIICLCWKTFQH